jgi:hypothetical protein
VGGLAHYLESEGLPTTQVSLIRPHTETIKPPRALWVPFELGRPLGEPNDPEFQKRVILAALDLFERSSGPVLEDFPEDAPSQYHGAGGGTPTCPVSFAREEEANAREALVLEVSRLSSWYRMAREKNGRTTVGVSGLDIPVAAGLLADAAQGLEVENPLPELSWPTLLRLAAEDVKAYYLESIASQPGRAATARDLADWFWGHTKAGETLQALKKVALRSEDQEMQLLGSLLLVPRAQAHRFED